MILTQKYDFYMKHSLCRELVLCPDAESTLQARVAKAEFPLCNSLLEIAAEARTASMCPTFSGLKTKHFQPCP